MTSKNGQTSLFGELTIEKSAGIAYSAAAVLLVLLSLLFGMTVGVAAPSEGFEKSDWYLYCSFLLPQLCFAVVAAVFFRKTKTSLKTAAGKCRPKYFLVAVLLQTGLFSLSALNEAFLEFLGRFGFHSEISLPSLNGFGFVGVLAVVALLPAVFEETFFRGILLGGLKSFGKVGAVLLCGGLFSLYHQNPAQTVYQFFCGAAFALVALRAGSILPTVLSHFLNNALIIALEKAGVSALPKAVQIPFTVVSALCLVGSLVYLVFFDRSGEAEKSPRKKGFFLGAAVGIVVYAALWLGALAAGIMGE